MPKLPLLVHLIFHPESGSSRELARRIHRQWNDDVIVPGLRVPTIFCPLPDGDSPPKTHDLDLAAHSFVVPLADDRLSIDEAWCGLVADVWERCQTPRHRCVPVQLSVNAWPLDDRLKGVSFAKAYLAPEGEARDAFVVRRLVIELCRFLMKLESGDDETEAPVKLFLSHTKLDLEAEPKATRSLTQYLSVDQPVEAWFDSGDIPTGSEFAKAIKGGVDRTSLLVVLTDHYATREWCREEVLLAKEAQRPIAVIDALTNYEVRGFPYLGNVPRLRWDGNPAAAVDLLLKETLRHLHTAAVLAGSAQAGDQLFSRPPELATMVGLDPGSSVLYPDPPIGVGEASRLAKTKIKFATPLERLAIDRPLGGKVIALSTSESTDLERFGFDPIHVENAMLELSRYLLIKGAALAYGGNLGSAGYTRKLFELVRTHNAREGVKPFERIVNYRGWPLPRLSVAELAEWNQVSRTKELPRPSDVDETLDPDFLKAPTYFPSDKSARHRFAWARGMTRMREFQADKGQSGVSARVVLGGTFGSTVQALETGERKQVWYSGRIPGIFEEVMLSVKSGQPVFLIGAYGGVARLIIDLLRHKDRVEATWDYQRQAPHAAEMRQLYQERGLDWWDYPEMVALLREKGVAGINPLLSVADHEELFDTVDPVRMIEIFLSGLGKL